MPHRVADDAMSGCAAGCVGGCAPGHRRTPYLLSHDGLKEREVRPSATWGSAILEVDGRSAIVEKVGGDQTTGHVPDP
jgi:hypothetical protein